MVDHLSEVGKSSRILAIVALMVSSIVFGAAFLGVVAMLILSMPAEAEKQRELVGGAVVGAVFAGASLWMLIRLLLRTRAQNGVTLMPLWFIELFGVVLFIGNIAYAITKRSPLLVAESLSVIGAMIFVRCKVRAKLSQSENAEASNSPE